MPPERASLKGPASLSLGVLALDHEKMRPLVIFLALSLLLCFYTVELHEEHVASTICATYPWRFLLEWVEEKTKTKPAKSGLPGHTHTHTHTRVMALCLGLPGWAGTRKVKPLWISLKQETVSGSGISWPMCKSAPRSRRITMPAPHHSVFYRPNALPAAKPAASKEWRQWTVADKTV